MSSEACSTNTAASRSKVSTAAGRFGTWRSGMSVTNATRRRTARSSPAVENSSTTVRQDVGTGDADVRRRVGDRELLRSPLPRRHSMEAIACGVDDRRTIRRPGRAEVSAGRSSQRGEHLRLASGRVRPRSPQTAGRSRHSTEMSPSSDAHPLWRTVGRRMRARPIATHERTAFAACGGQRAIPDLRGS